MSRQPPFIAAAFERAKRVPSPLERFQIALRNTLGAPPSSSSSDDAGLAVYPALGLVVVLGDSNRRDRDRDSHGHFYIIRVAERDVDHTSQAIHDALRVRTRNYIELNDLSGKTLSLREEIVSTSGQKGPTDPIERARVRGFLLAQEMVMHGGVFPAPAPVPGTGTIGRALVSSAASKPSGFETYWRKTLAGYKTRERYNERVDSIEQDIRNWKHRQNL